MNDSEQASSSTDPGEGSKEAGFQVPSVTELGWLLMGGGLVGCLITLLRRNRHLDDWILPFGLMGAGSALLLKRRQGRMDVAQGAILAELDALDPIARAQVLKAVASQELDQLKP